MNNLLKIITSLSLLMLYSYGYSMNKVLELDPIHQLTMDEVYDVAVNNRPIRLSKQSLENIKKSHEVVKEMALSNKPVYGLTTGLGWNKDKPVFTEINGRKFISEELLQLSKKFNISSLRAHASGLGEPLPTRIIRAAMLIRLNNFIRGEAGVSLDVAKIYEEFLNLGITPIVPSYGSVGESDITLASHIGLVMIGEWKAEYKGNIYPASEILKKTGIKPVELVGKDFLSILSNNSITIGEAVLNTLAAEIFYHQEVRLFALMLEGLNGNVAPFSKEVINLNNFENVKTTSLELTKVLNGSDLWNYSNERALQDPLSFRTMIFALSNTYEAIQEAKKALTIQINTSDDNPTVLLNIEEPTSSQLQSYILNNNDDKLSGIFPTSNFNILSVVIKIETLNIALARLSENMTQQIIRISDPSLTKLSRFLAAPTNNGHSFGAIEKTFTYSNIRIKNLALPQSYHTIVVAGNIEDTGSMSTISIKNLGHIIHHLYEISAFQILESTQSLDLRKDFKLSDTTYKIKQNYRKEIPFISEDQIFTTIIEKSIKFVKSIQIQ